MTTRLASETISITVNGGTVELRPTLRAALRLARRYGTYGALISKLSEGSIDVIADVLKEGGEVAKPYVAIMGQIEARGMISIVPIISHLIAFVVSLAGPQSDDNGNAKASGEPMTFEAFHEELFAVATGWLGWTPANAWAATPGEIIAAHKGRTAMLKAIYGSGEGTGENTKPHDELSLDDQALAVFGGRKRKRAA